MTKKGHHFIEVGDCIRLRKSGREKLKRNLGVDAFSSDIFIVKNKKFAKGTRKYLITLSIRGKKIGLYLSDITLAV